MSQVILFQLPPVPYVTYGFLKATSVCGSSLSHTMVFHFTYLEVWLGKGRAYAACTDELHERKCPKLATQKR